MASVVSPFSVSQAHRCALTFLSFFCFHLLSQSLLLVLLVFTPIRLFSSLLPHFPKAQSLFYYYYYRGCFFACLCAHVCVCVCGYVCVHACVRVCGRDQKLREAEGREVCVCRSVGGRVRVLCDAWLMSLTSSSQASFHTYTHTQSQK